METIFDYILKNNKKITKENFNSVDSLILARLSYLPIHKLLTKNEKSSLKRILSILECFSEKMFLDYKNDIKLINLLYTSKRFNDLVVSDCDEIVNKDTFEQFGALVVDLEYAKYISFKGTDKSIIGIKEDLDMSYKDIESQKKALIYFDDIASKYDDKFILGGHSKGGNIAIYAAIFTNDDNKDRIYNIYNFDGPGFLPEILENEGYTKILPKIITIVPSSSVIGLLLNRKEKVKIVESSNFFVMQHDLYSFEIKGKDFKYVKKLTKISKYTEGIMKNIQESLSDEEKKGIIDNVYKFLENDEIKNINEISIKSIAKLIGNRIKTKKKEKKDD